MDVVDFVKSFPLKTFQKGEVLLSAAQSINDILIIREGAVKVSSYNDLGGERLLWIAGRYDIIPTEHIFNRRSLSQYFYTAFCDGSAYAVRKEAFLAKASAHPEIMSQVALGLSEHYDDLLSHLNSVGQPGLRHKILFMLQTLCRKFSSANVVKLHGLGLNLTHQDIADMVQATREAVSIELKQLQTEGYIDYSRSTFTVHFKKVAEEIKASA